MGHTDVKGCAEYMGHVWGVEMYREAYRGMGVYRCMGQCTDVWGHTDIWGMYEVYKCTGGCTDVWGKYRCGGHTDTPRHTDSQIYSLTCLPTTPGYYISYEIVVCSI